MLCLGGKIVSVGKSKDALRDSWLKKNRKRVIEIDCERQVVLPGFVDSHTHPAFITPRLVDFEKRISGATYEEIAEAGGGIRSSVEGVRKAGKSQLAEKVLQALREMAEQGTTTVEAKSGYGLTLESELKSLGAIRRRCRPLARHGGPHACSVLMSFPKNFKAARRRVCRPGLRRDDSAGRKAEAGSVCGCVSPSAEHSTTRDTSKNLCGSPAARAWECGRI